MKRPNTNQITRQLREAQRRVDRQIQRHVDQINRENKRRAEEHNRQVDAHNRRQIAAFNAQLREAQRRAEVSNRHRLAGINAKTAQLVRQADAQSRRTIAELNRQLRATSSPVRYTEGEQRFADRVRDAISPDPREYDSFLSYARIDGSEVAEQLRSSLVALGVAVWFDAVAIVPGHSQALQMDDGLRKARSGIALLTPAYLTGRFWTERELGVLLSKATLIPVLHNVTFDDVKQYSGILPDLAGFSTASDDIDSIAEKIAGAVLTE